MSVHVVIYRTGEDDQFMISSRCKRIEDFTTNVFTVRVSVQDQNGSWTGDLLPAPPASTIRTMI